MAHDARVYELVARALDVDAGARPAFVRAAAGADAALAEEVLRLVEAGEALGGFLGTSAPEALGLASRPAPDLAPGTLVGRYRILAPLGRGSGGTTYEALQESPRRRVALKVAARVGDVESPAWRLRDEAEVLARLRHPSIAQVFEAGVEAAPGRAFAWLAMELVEGATDVVTFARTRPVGDRVDLLAAFADALHHAHGHGILHGDVKPGNLLVDGDGRPKVIDLGVARRLGAPPDGTTAGTPGYMAPEQGTFPPAPPDARSDVWALGAVLHEMLVGAPPADGPEGARRGASLRGDLAAIVRKALADDPAARYASAAALADDLRRHRARRPVEARAPRWTYVAARFAQREPVKAGLLVTVMAVSIAAAVVGGRLAAQRERERVKAERRAYVAGLAGALGALEIPDVGEARTRLEQAPAALRGWEWQHVWRRTDDAARVLALEGRRVVSGVVCAEGTRAVALWEGEGRQVGASILDLRDGGREAVALPLSAAAYAAALEAGGARFALGGYDGSIELRDGASGRVLVRRAAHDGTVNALAFDARGRWVASAGRDRTVRLWRADDLSAQGEVAVHDDRAICVAFDPEGRRVASGSRDATIRVTGVGAESSSQVLRGHEGSVDGVAWSPDGTRLASVSHDRTLRLWDVAKGREVAVARGHDGNVDHVAFAPDGAVIATTARDRTVRLWGADRAEALARLVGHRVGVRGVGFVPGPQGRPHAVSFGGDVRWFPVAAREAVPTLRGHRDRVATLAFSPSGRWLASAAEDGTLRVWEPGARVERARLEAPSARYPTVVFVADDRVGVLVGSTLHAWRLDGAGRGGEAEVHPHVGTFVARSTREGVVVAGDATGALRLYDLATRRVLLEGPRLRAPVRALAADAVGRRVAALAEDGDLVVLEPRTLRPTARRRVHGGRAPALAVSGDGARVAHGGGRGPWQVLATDTLEAIATPYDPGSGRATFAFSPDGRRLASGGDDGGVRIWDAATGEVLATLLGARHPIWSLAWSPDGRTLASGEGDWEDANSCIRLWEVP